MGKINRKYQFRGLDTRSNKLSRVAGTASDCRNVYLNSNKDLLKRPDFDSLNVPRADDGDLASAEPNGEFEDKLPYDAEIIDFLEYEDHILLITRIPIDLGGPVYYSNKFYKYVESTNTVEFLAVSGETAYSSAYGAYISNPLGCLGGRVSAVLQDNILYFMGSLTERDFSITTNSPTDQIAEDNNLCYMFSYDGLMVSKAGVPQATKADTTFDQNTLASDDYVRILPFKFNSKNDITFGNYTTHLSNQSGNNQDVSISQQEFFTAGNQFMQFQANFRVRDSGGMDPNYIIVSAGPLAVNADIHMITDVYGERRSCLKGQYLYFFDNQDNGLNPRTVAYDLYRVKVTDVDYGTGGLGGDDAVVTIDDYYKFNETTQTFKPFTPNILDTITLDENTYVSNILYAIYASSDFTFGHKVVGFTSYAINLDTDTPIGLDFDFSYPTTKGASALSAVTIENPIFSIAEEFEDGYDEGTVKGVPPRGYQVVDYLGANLIVDHKSLYFSDISVGGNVETFTPFDNFKVGSDSRGRITGVFANETFITVFREREAYYITGNIFITNYRIQSYQSTRIGCTDPRSIIDLRGAGLFLSERGFYLCQQGGAMPEISDLIETIFTDGELGLDLDLSKCASIVDFQREHLLFHIASNTNSDGYIFVFSYYNNEWFLWGEVNANGGIRDINSTIYHSDGRDLYKEAGTNTDSLAYYRSNFDTLGAPSFEKKFLQALLYTIDMPERARITIKTFRNWITDKFDTKESKNAKAGQIDLTQRFNPTRSKSLAIQIESASGQAFRINGYEYEVDDDVKMFKDDD